MKDYSYQYHGRFYKLAWVVNEYDYKVSKEQVFSCRPDGKEPKDLTGYWWVPGIGFSLPQNHLYETEREALQVACRLAAKRLSDAEAVYKDAVDALTMAESAVRKARP